MQRSIPPKPGGNWHGRHMALVRTPLGATPELVMRCLRPRTPALAGGCSSPAPAPTAAPTPPPDPAAGAATPPAATRASRLLEGDSRGEARVRSRAPP